MALTTQERTNITKLVVAMFNAAPGATYLAELATVYEANGRSLSNLAKDLANTTAYKALNPVFQTAGEFAVSFLTPLGLQANQEAIDFITAKFNAGVSKGQIAYDAAVALNASTSATFADAKAILNNKTAVSEYYSVTKNIAQSDIATLQQAISSVTKDAASVASANAAIDNGSVTSEGFTLTNGTDTATSSLFNAGLIYNPAGTDRINALQSEDKLTGSSTTTDNVLNATLGKANDNGSTSVTPTLKNIQAINLEFTGDTNKLDVRFADSLKSLSVNKMTAEAGDVVTIDNIGQPAANLAVRDSALVGNTVNFNYVDGVLKGTTAAGTAETGNVAVSNVNLTALHIGNVVNKEGFETLNLTASNTNQISKLEAADLEVLNIKGSGNLSIVNTAQEVDRLKYNVNGIAIGDGLGIRTIDASTFTGSLNLDITKALGGHADPANSGAKYFATVTGSAGADTFWSNASIAAESTTLKDTLNGGAGADTLKMMDASIARSTNVAKVLPTITGIEALELRLQGAAAQEANLAAFDASLATVTLRNEQSAAAAPIAGAFDLREVGKTIAENGITLLHASGRGAGNVNGVATNVVDTVAVRLNDSTGAADLVSLTVKSDLNTSSTYDYAIQLKTEAAFVVGATAAQIAASKVENLTINDLDDETNTVTITGNDSATAKDLTGTVTLTGGSVGKTFTVASTLTASTVQASTQASNLVLNVGVADQSINLGTGNDTLTFDGVDTFNGSDKLSDAGGTDTVRAAFTKDVTGTPELAGIEKLQIVATANATVDLVKGQGITELAILSDNAVNEVKEVFTTGLAGVDITDVITLKNTKLDSVNFFGDEDAVVAGTTVATVQTFNGLTLENNTGDKVAVKISAPLQNLTNLAGNGITTYNLGQLTTHGVKDLSIVVSNELVKTAAAPGVTTTTIANIWDRDLVNLTLTATGNVNVGTVTGNTVNSNIKTFDASKVGGNTTAIVKALGDNAVVTLAGGDDAFNALGSAGNNVVFNGGEGNNTITGTAQSDYIYTGAGNDIIHADRGNNTVKAGAGNDAVDALNGSNTVDLGAGFADQVTFNYDTAGQQNLATNLVAGSGTNAFIRFDADNNGVAETTYGFAVGNGAELSLKFTGTTFDATASTLNGRSAIEVTANATPVVEASLSNLIVLTGAIPQTAAIAGGSAADVVLDFRTGTGGNYNVSTGAGNDAIVISQSSTANHTITAGAGADRVVLSAMAGGTDTLVVLEGDSILAGRDVVSNFTVGTDILDVSTAATAGTLAHLTSAVFTAAVGATPAVNLVVSGAGAVTLSAGIITATNVDAVLTFLAANATTSNDAYFVSYDSNGDGAVNTSDNVIVFQNLGTDIVVELVGSATNNVSGVTIASVV